MADLYDIDFKVQVAQLLSPTKRLPTITALTNAAIAVVQYLRDLTFDDYKKGASYAAYNNATSYNKYDRVKWKDRAIYEARVPTTGVPPTGDVLSETNWRQTQANFVGFDKRLQYNAQLIQISTALNEWYGCAPGSYMWFDSTLYSQGIFTLNVKAAVWAALGATDDERYASIQGFFNQYLLAGMVTYQVMGIRYNWKVATY